MADKPIIKTRGLKKSFFVGEQVVNALSGADVEINEGEFVVIFGPSGSGKTTLLSTLAGLDRPTEGELLVDGIDIYNLHPKELAKYRRSKIGMVFQQFNLVPSLTARDNVSLPLILSGVSRKEAYTRATQLLKLVSMSDRADHKPSQLSGGQQQRIAIARALATNPQILLVDEPTGNLDVPTGDEIMALLTEINQKWGRTVVLVTHNPDFLHFGDRIIYMRDGKVVKEERNSRKPIASEKNDLQYYSCRQGRGMSKWEIIRLSRIHFFSKRLRTFLTVLGVALGVGSIVTLVSLGVGLQKITSNQLASLDALVTINVSLSKNSINKLDDSAVSKLSNLDDVSLVSPGITLPAKATVDGSTAQVIIMAINPEALDFEGVSMLAGNKAFDNNGVIVSRAVAKNFDASNPTAIVGKEINMDIVVIPDDTLDLSQFKNIKSVKKVAGVSNDDVLTSVYMPLQEIKTLTDINDYSSIRVKVSDRKKVAEVRDNIEKLGFSTTSVVDLINQVDRVFLITQIVLGIIGGVALIVALIGIVNIMTISLLERTHEVGIMKAIGATNGDIKKIFEYEVILFGFFGSVAGVFGAWFFGESINWIVAVLMKASGIAGSIQIFSTPGFFAFEMILLTVLVSLAAGLYPARRAAKLSPMEALRYE